MLSQFLKSNVRRQSNAIWLKVHNGGQHNVTQDIIKDTLQETYNYKIQKFQPTMTYKSQKWTGVCKIYLEDEAAADKIVENRRHVKINNRMTFIEKVTSANKLYLNVHRDEQDSGFTKDIGVEDIIQSQIFEGLVEIQISQSNRFAQHFTLIFENYKMADKAVENRKKIGGVNEIGGNRFSLIYPGPRQINVAKQKSKLRKENQDYRYSNGFRGDGEKIKNSS